jgi:ABC-type glycerol-3-phosphate transport system permease component
MTDDALKKVARAYRISYLVCVGWGILAAGVALLAAYFLTKGTYPVATAGAWNLAYPVGCLMVGAIVTTIGVRIAVRALRGSY